MKRFSQVTSNLFRGGEPSDEDLFLLRNIWKVNRIVSLDQNVGDTIHPICEKLGFEHLIVPLFKEGVDGIDFDEIAKNVVDLLSSNPPTFVHCVHGRDRTGLVIALYRMLAQDWSAEEAIKEALAFDFGDGFYKSLKKACIFYLKTLDKEKSEDNKYDVDVNDIVPNGPLDSRHSFTPDVPIQNYYSDQPIEFRSSRQVGETERNVGQVDFSDVDDQERRKKRKARKRVLEDMNDAMAQVGVFENANPINRGIGPIEPVGYLPRGYSYLM